MKARNPALYRNLKKFTEEAINLIQEKVASPDDIPTRSASKLETEKEGVWSIKEVEKPQWGLLIRLQGPHLVQLNSYASCVRLLQEDTVIAPHLDKLVGIYRGGASMVQTSQILPRFITSLLSYSESLSPNQKQFDALYERMEDFFYSPQLNVSLIAPLINVKGPSQPTSLTDNISIVPNSDNRLGQWISDTREGVALVPWRAVPNLTHSLQHQFAAPKVIQGATEITAEEAPAQAGESSLAVAINSMKRMVTALRLLKPGYVAIPFIEYHLLEWHPMPMGASQAPLYPPYWRTFSPNYVIQETDVPDIAALYRALSHEILSKHGFIKVAVHRIERSVEETEPTERLVDLVIALEALLLADIGPADLRGELAFRLSLRGACFLASDAAQRQRLYQEFKKAYRLRNRIVHGDEPPLEVTIFRKRMPIKELVNRIENYTREVAKRMLQLAMQPNAIRELVKWDDLVLGTMEFN